MTRVLITGCRGFIGANLTKHLLGEGYEVYGVDLPSPAAGDALKALHVEPSHLYLRSVTDEGIRGVFVHAKPDLVVHLAAQAIVSEAQKRPREAFQTNVMGTVNVLEACREYHVPVLIASSDKAYGQGRAMHEQMALDPLYPYDVSKACSDLISQCYARTYGLKVMVIRCCNVFGPGDLNWSRIVPRTARNVVEGKPAVIYERMGEVRREYVHVDDACDAYALLAEKLLNGEWPKDVGLAVNIGTGNVHTAREMVAYICDVLDRPDLVPTSLQAKDFWELEDQSLDRSSLESLGWRAKREFGEALQSTVRWYEAYLKGGGT